MKRIAFSTLLMAGVAVIGMISAQAAPVNSTGHWKIVVTASGGGSSVTAAGTFNQVGQTVVGHFNHNTINGEMVSDTKMNGKWNGPRGAGWMTLTFSSNGSSFQGTWGLNGKKADGDLVGRKLVASPAPAPTKPG